MRIFLALALVFSGGAFAKNAPSFQAELMSGGKTSLKDQLKPNRVLFLSFWASWCGPCLEELKHVSETMAKETTLPLDVLTVNTDTSETASDVKPTLRLHKLTFPVILDPKHEIFGKYNQSKTLPYSVLVNPKGEIIQTFNGYDEQMFTRVKEALATQGGTKEAPKAKDKEKESNAKKSG